MIENNYGLITESWFSDLVDKGKRGALKVASDAGEVLVNLAKKAKDILDFAKQLANKIGEYIKSQFTKLKDRIKNHVKDEAGLSSILLEFLGGMNRIELRSRVSGVMDLIKYILSGQIITDTIDRLSETFSKVLNLGTNEGLTYLEDEFLFESEENEEKKSFLQRLGEKVMSFPPFSWIPKIEELLKKGISFLGKLVDRFLYWLTTGKDDYPMLGSKFERGITFIFQILELYVNYKIVGKIEKFKEMLKKTSGLEEFSNEMKDKSPSEVWKTCGINPDEISNTVKDAIKKTNNVL